MKKKYFILILVFIFIFTIASEVYAYSDKIDNEDNLSFSMLILKIIFYLFCFIIVLILAFYTSKVIARKTNSLAKSNNMEMLESISIDKNNRVVVLKIFDTLYILSVNNNQTTIIDKINEEEVFFQNKQGDKNKKNFQEYFNSFFISFKNNTEVQRDKKIYPITNRLYEIKEKIKTMKATDVDIMPKNEDENNE